MRTLESAADRRAILARISALAPSDRRSWGRMSVHQMVCHLCDSYRAALGEKSVSRGPAFAPRPMMKWVALRLPVKWPQGIATRPEVEQGVGGTVPGEFEADRAELLGVTERFCAGATGFAVPHPIFGPMSGAEWLRWGYLHADHHLRQFGR